jgi:mono/diheme cytochrome c family protein
MNQLEALERAGYLLLPDDPAALPAWPAIDDAAAPLQERARAWLDTNCSQCHRPGTPQPMDLRGHTPFASAGLCDALPRHGDLGIADARIIAPGDPARSVLFHRMSRRGPNQMPPLGTAILEDAAVDVVRAWIQGLRCR